jgi:hypothetical protein
MEDLKMNSPFLRRVLIADSVISGATGLGMLLGAGLLDGLLGLPGGLLRWTGLSLVPFAAAVSYLATRERLTAGSVKFVIGLNALWVLASVALLVSGAITPNVLGYGFILLQAVVVGVFAELQYMGLRRTRAALA